MVSLGELKILELDEIRRIWPTEEKHLSPWIAENVEALNSVLNLQIEIDSQEEYVHGFRLDLAGTDTFSQMPVIIENQFGKSNHDHLGKLITYSAAKVAGIVIWISNEIQIAHRVAIDWLNEISPQEMSFYGVELEVFRIDDSLPAPNFRVVAGPPPSKRRAVVSGQITPRNKLYQDFWAKLRSELLHRDPNFTRAKAPAQSWWLLGIGRSGFSLEPCFTIDNRFRIGVLIGPGSKDSNDDVFAQLKESGPMIEERIGEKLVWDPMPDSRWCRVYTAVAGSIDDGEERLTEIIEWATPLMIRFRQVFGPLVKNIELEG